MNQPPNDPNSGMQTPPGYGAPQQQPGYGAPGHSGPVQNSGSYQQPQGVRGMTRQMFNPRTYKQPGSGSWAAASLTLAIIGWVTLGCLGFLTWPLGLLFGLIGMIGNKRGKGLSAAGFVLSGAGIACIVALFALGFWQMAWSEGYAEQGGKPVVAAIDQFKADNDRVPYSLEELVEQGYLPKTWDQGLDEIDDEVSKVVKGKRWQDFLVYAPGKDAAWEGTPDAAVDIDASLDGVSINLPEGMDENPQTYGLVFIGVDSQWGTYDDNPVNQAPDEAYDLARIWDADPTTREAMKKKRQLGSMLRKVDDKLELVNQQIGSAKESLQKHETRLLEIARDQRLSREEIKTNPDTKEWLKLIGETRRRIEITKKKEQSLTTTRNRLEAKVERLGNQVELAKIADNKEELVEMQRLLDESKELLDGDEESYFTEKTDDDFADEWLNEQFN